MLKHSKIMLREHERINEFLEEFSECRNNDLNKFMEIFSRFKWNLEKHFFLEEKAIFNVLEITDGTEVSDIFDLMQEHGDILKETKKVGKTLSQNSCPDMTELIEKLQKHAEFEDHFFYPKLDNVLSHQQKEEIIKRAEEIIRGDVTSFSKAFIYDIFVKTLQKTILSETLKSF